jgi:hypothetical protein
MGGARKLSLALVAAICAAILAACGGSGDSTATTPTDSTTAESTAGAPSTPNGGNGEDKSSKGSKGKDGQGGTNGGGNGDGAGGESNGGGESSGGSGGSGSVGSSFSGPPTKHKHPAPVDGQRSDGFRTPGGDNSIQEYGEETDAAERAAAMVPIAGLYRALESGDWTAVCSTYLSASNVEQLKLLGEQSSKGTDCAAVLGGLHQSTAKGPDTPDGGIVSFRVEGDTGFAIYWGIDGKGYAFALKSEGGAWKLTALAPTPLQIG